MAICSSVMSIMTSLDVSALWALLTSRRHILCFCRSLVRHGPSSRGPDGFHQPGAPGGIPASPHPAWATSRRRWTWRERTQPGGSHPPAQRREVAHHRGYQDQQGKEDVHSYLNGLIIRSLVFSSTLANFQTDYWYFWARNHTRSLCSLWTLSHQYFFVLENSISRWTGDETYLHRNSKIMSVRS